MDHYMPQSGPTAGSPEPTRDVPKLPDMKIGDKSKRGVAFCPWKLIRGYPYRYAGKDDQEAVSVLPRLWKTDDLCDLGGGVLQLDDIWKPHLGFVSIPVYCCAARPRATQI